MEFSALQSRAKEIKEHYRVLNQKHGAPHWGIAEYMQGFMGDVGDLAKLVMARERLRTIENADEKLKHELADCLWSLMAIADEAGIDLEKEFLKTMAVLEERTRAS